MTYLPDVNVWIALYAELSTHHEAACQWFEGIGEADVVFCRLTQLGFLRLLTNRHVMQEEVLSPAAAWEANQSIRQNPKVGFAVELAGFPEVWRAPGATLASSPNLWTDAYLAAFARENSFTLVTFDQKLPMQTGARALVLGVGSQF